MHVDLDGEAAGDHAVDGAIDAAEELIVEAIGPVRILIERGRVDAEANIVKPEAGHECDVCRVNVSIGAGGGVVAGRLRKPHGCVDAVLQVTGAEECGFEACGAVLRG